MSTLQNTWLNTQVPEGGTQALRQQIYKGEVYLLAPTQASTSLVDQVNELLASTFVDVGGPAHASESMSNSEYFERVGRLRRLIYCDPHYHEAVRDIMRAGGFDPSQVAFDPARLRVIAHQGHLNQGAAPVYAIHRDTWYSHPQSLITWWIPLHDIPATETFVFYPQCFDRPVPNDSEIFDYSNWTKDGPDLKIGWQDIEAGAKAPYPAYKAGSSFNPGPEQGFSCQKGQNLLFSGSHLHGTLPHAAGYNRYSLDFRVVHLPDTAHQRGAPKVDNRSQGSSIPDYILPPPQI